MLIWDFARTSTLCVLYSVCDPQLISSHAFLIGISGAVEVRETEMLTAGGGPTSSSEVSRNRLPRGKDLIAGCEVEAFPRTMFECWEVWTGGGSESARVG